MIELESSKSGKLEKKYPRVVEALRRRINRGVLTGALPGVKQLAVEFDVNFMTVDKAIRKLEDEGLVYRIPRKGSYVSRLKNIALVFNDPNQSIMSAPIYMRMIGGLQSQIRASNCSLIFENLNQDLEHRAAMLARKIDGMIMVLYDQFVPPEPLRHIPCIQAMGQVDTQVPWDHVSYDNSAIGPIAARYLAERGHRRAALICNCPSHLFAIRCQGFEQTFAALGGETVRYPSTDTFDINEIVAQIDQLLADPNHPTAIFAPSDGLMHGVCNILSARGIRPTLDFDLIGCDAEADLWHGMPVTPATINVHVEKIGAEAWTQLFKRINHPDVPRYVHMFTPELVLPQTISNRG